MNDELEVFKNSRKKLEARLEELRGEIREIERALGLAEDVKPYAERRPGWIACRQESRVGRTILGYLGKVERGTLNVMTEALKKDGVSRQRLYSALSSLAQQGLVERVERGEYRIAKVEEDLFGAKGVTQ